MQEKKKRLMVFVIIALVLGVANILVFRLNMSSSGMAINQQASSGFFSPDLSTIVFMLQWLFVALLFIISFVKYSRQSKITKIDTTYSSLRKSASTSATDIDLLLNLLKEKKKLSLKQISQVFSINKERALEWCKILEESSLAEITYPAFSEPRIEIR